MGNYKFKFSADIQQVWKKMETSCIFILSKFVIHSQVMTFSVFKIALENFETVKMRQSYTEFKGGNFLRHSVVV